MARFRFRLEQVLAYRRQRKEEAMQLLAAATGRRDRVRDRCARLRTEIREQQAILTQAHTLSPAERWLAQSYAQALAADLVQAEEELRIREQAVDACRQDLVKKAQEHELLETLREKQAARHAQQERRNEQQVNDETATLRFSPVAF